MSLQGEKDWQKYETARRLKKCVDKIRNQYREDWKSKEMKVRQRAVALYFIDKVRASSCHTAYHVHLHEDGGSMYSSRPCVLPGHVGGGQPGPVQDGRQSVCSWQG